MFTGRKPATAEIATADLPYKRSWTAAAVLAVAGAVVWLVVAH